MPEVAADPDKLRDLAKTLINSAGKLDELARQITRSAQAAQWRDKEGQKFDAQLMATLKSLSAIANQLKSDYPPQLQKKAGALDQYRQ
ncbi:WXG100-like domain-containing protein [Pseudonocardia saturnea]